MSKHTPKPPRRFVDKTSVLSASTTRLIVLDRDGVINREAGYVRTMAQWEWCHGAPEAMRALWAAGYSLAICTNQSAVGRGLMTFDEYYDLLEEIRTAYYWYHWPQPYVRGYPWTFACLHAPNDNCDCRKPKAGLWTEISEGYPRIELHNSWFLDDKFENLEFGRTAGLNLAWITTDKDDVREPLDYRVFGSLHHFAETLLKRKIHAEG